MRPFQNAIWVPHFFRCRELSVPRLRKSYVVRRSRQRRREEFPVTCPFARAPRVCSSAPQLCRRLARGASLIGHPNRFTAALCIEGGRELRYRLFQQAGLTRPCHAIKRRRWSPPRPVGLPFAPVACKHLPPTRRTRDRRTR